MKRVFSFLTVFLIVLTGCSNDSSSSMESNADEESAGLGETNSESTTEATPIDLDSLSTEERAILNARPDHELYDRYSDESVIEDAHHTCDHIAINVEHGNSIGLHTLDQIYSANSRAQTRRMDDPAYPDDTPYLSDMEYPVEQALVHLCPEVLDDVERAAFDSMNAFTKASNETGYTYFTEDGYAFSDE